MITLLLRDMLLERNSTEVCNDYKLDLVELTPYTLGGK